MRELWFRGKRKDNGEWVEGENILIVKTENGKRAYIAQTGTQTAIFESEEHSDVFVATPAFSRVIPETVGQYTGLTDRNGTKIFEGDILESEFTKMPYLVCFGEYTYTDEYGDGQDVCGWYNEDECGYVTAFGCSNGWATVIGNIHDNPELLKGE